MKLEEEKKESYIWFKAFDINNNKNIKECIILLRNDKHSCENLYKLN